MRTIAIEDIYELTPLQAGMLFHTLYDPDSRPYLEQVVVPMDGSVDRQAFERAWGEVVAANTTLRTSFHWEETDKPIQVVHRAAQISFVFLDLRQVPPHRQTADLAARLEADRQRGIDIATAPLMRVALIRLGATRYRLVLTFHHAILDGWSLQIIIRQFTAAYRALAQGNAAEPIAAHPYRDYIGWLQKQDLNAASRYWRKVLVGHDHSARLPQSFEPGPDQPGAYESLLDSVTTSALRDFARRHKLTLNTLVQGAWAILLGRWTGSDDVVFGVTVSGRPAELPNVDEIAGLFINTLPIRIRLPAQERLTTWLAGIQNDQFEARQFEYSPLTQIQEWAGLPGGTALFETILAFENYPVQLARNEETSGVVFVEQTNYLLSAIVVPGDRLKLRLLYNGRSLSGQTIELLATHFATILAAIAATPADRRVDQLDLLSAEDKQSLRNLNATWTDYPRCGVPQLFDEQAARQPDKIAVEFGGKSVTYEMAARRANQIANRLVQLKVRLGDTVGLLFPNGVELVLAMLGVLKAGGVYVPLDPSAPRRRNAAILSEVGATVIIADPHLTTVAANFGRRVLTLDPGFSALSEAPDYPPSITISGENHAYVMFTSGSTGRPKGTIIPHRAIVRLVRENHYLTIQQSDRIALVSNCAFDAVTFEIWGALLNGAALVGIEFDVMLSPMALQRQVRDSSISVIFVNTALFNEIAAQTPEAFCSLRAVLFGGEAANARSVRRVFEASPQVALLHVYGPTEAATFSTWHPITAQDVVSGIIPIGHPIGNTRVYVLDQAMLPVAPGQTGELYIGGDGLAHGYLAQPGLTAERFVPDPFSTQPGPRLYRTGDKVRWDENGAMVFVGRYDDQIKLRGYRIEPREIEEHLKKRGDLREAIVVARRDDREETQLAAYAVPEVDPQMDLVAILQRDLREHFPPYMLPGSITLLTSLPLTRNGKIDRTGLPDPDHRSVHQVDVALPITPYEQRLAALWQEVLGAKAVDVHENFFHIGGHSLRATQLVSRIQREFGVEVPLRAVFEHPTIAGQAIVLERLAVTPGTAPLPVIKRVARDRQNVAMIPSSKG